ncbi:pickpocket 7 [Oratosquilla oratoria]|uniref:pickpocket 7 n=1 Tax=Oratosquilla oratoria TaxID=337810 RepID=UPI003F75A6A4
MTTNSSNSCNFDYKQVTQNESYTNTTQRFFPRFFARDPCCEDVLVKCKMGVNPFKNQEDCCELLTSIPTLMGSCLYGAANEYIRQFVVGEHMGSTMILKKAFNDSPGDSTYLETGNVISIQLQLTLLDQNLRRTLIDWWEPKCVPPSALDISGRTNESYYQTSTNCLLANLRRCVRALSNCSVYGLDMVHEDLEPCTVIQLITTQHFIFRGRGLSSGSNSPRKTNLSCWNNDITNCRPVCTEMTFNHVVEVQTMNRMGAEELMTMTNESVVQVSVFYPQMRYTKVNVYRDSLLDLVGNLGGQMGLMLGCSIVTVMESATFLLLCILALFQRKL